MTYDPHVEAVVYEGLKHSNFDGLGASLTCYKEVHKHIYIYIYISIISMKNLS